jgi:hypothetical protein
MEIESGMLGFEGWREVSPMCESGSRRTLKLTVSHVLTFHTCRTVGVGTKDTGVYVLFRKPISKWRYTADRELSGFESTYRMSMRACLSSKRGDEIPREIVHNHCPKYPRYLTMSIHSVWTALPHRRLLRASANCRRNRPSCRAVLTISSANISEPHCGRLTSDTGSPPPSSMLRPYPAY